MQKLKRLPLLIIIIAIFFTLGVSFAKVAKASFFNDLKAMVLGEEDEEENEDNKEEDDNQQNTREQEREQRKNENEQKRETSKQEWENKREQIKQEIEAEREEWKESWKIKRDEIKAEALKEKEAWKNMREKFTEEKCADIQERIIERTKKFDEKKGKHVGVYTNLVNRIQKFINKFKAAGLDTTKIEGDLVTLKSKIEEFKTAYAVYIAKLKGTQTLACGHAEGDFRSQLTDAKAELKIVHEIAADIRVYVRTVILADLKALKALMPKEEDENDSDDQDENDEADTRVPAVSITAPATGSAYTAASTIAIVANATDNKGVAKVEFYDGATLKATDTTMPYSYDWAVTVVDNGAHSWTAKAYDTAATANTATSAPVSLTVTIAPTP